MHAIQTILHPSDFSENSRFAFQTACSLAQTSNARLIILHVLPPASLPIREELPPNPLESAESQVTRTGKLPWPQPSETGLHVEHRVAEGDPASEILRVAQSCNCDLIVMGTHGRTGLARLLAGSVAEDLLRKAPCPVLAVKLPLGENRLVAPAPLAKPGEIVDVRPLGESLAVAQTRPLIKVNAVEVIRLIVPRGRVIPEQEVNGDVILHCLEGQVTFTASGTTKAVRAGELVYFPPKATYTIQGSEDASLLSIIHHASQ